jgi:hypothetical protein
MEKETIIILIIILLIVGFYGGAKTESANYFCDIGAEGVFCIWWHQTAIGGINEVFTEMGMDEFLG